MQHNLPKVFGKELVELLNDLFDWLVEPCVEFIKFNCKFQLNTSFIHLITSTMRLFSCLISELSDPANAELSPQVVSVNIYNRQIKSNQIKDNRLIIQPKRHYYRLHSGSRACFSSR